MHLGRCQSTPKAPPIGPYEPNRRRCLAEEAADAGIFYRQMHDAGFDCQEHQVEGKRNRKMRGSRRTGRGYNWKRI